MKELFFLTCLFQRDGGWCEPLQGEKKASFRSRVAEPLVSNLGMHRYQSIGLVRVLEEIDFKSVTGVVPRMRTFVPEVDYTSVSGTFYIETEMIEKETHDYEEN